MDSRYLVDAFWRVTSTIEGPGTDRLSIVLESFVRFQNDPRGLLSAIKRKLPEGSWDWPEFARHLSLKGEPSKYADMCEMLRMRVTRMAMERMRQEQRQESLPRQPWWIFRPGDDAKPSCRLAGECLEHYASEFWDDHTPVCEWLECDCRVFVEVARHLHPK